MALINTLLNEIVDYAGLFPPAGLPLDTVVAHYQAYRRSPYRWMLASLVVPLQQLPELEDRRQALGDGGDCWPISCVVPTQGPMAGSVHEIWQQIDEFNHRCGGLARVDAVEVRADSAAAIAAHAQETPESLRVFWELPLDDRLPGMVAELGKLSSPFHCAKIRTGGVVATAMPAPELVARFLRICGDLRVAWKATAGLHHPLRGSYRLTYEPASACGTMFGFINVFLAAALEWHFRPSESALIGMLTADAPSEIEWTTNAIRWRDWLLDEPQLSAARSQFALSFGSCSFLEPTEELVQLGWLESQVADETLIPLHDVAP